MDECVKLEVHPEQKDFVASNLYTLAEAYTIITNDGHVSPYAIYTDNKMVGFIIYEYYDEEDPDDEDDWGICYQIWRLMIDKNHQGKGYGKLAVEKVIEEIKTLPYGPAEYIYISYEPENEVARNLYQSFGFVETDLEFDDDCDEIIARRSI